MFVGSQISVHLSIQCWVGPASSSALFTSSEVSKQQDRHCSAYAFLTPNPKTSRRSFSGWGWCSPCLLPHPLLPGPLGLTKADKTSDKSDLKKSRVPQWSRFEMNAKQMPPNSRKVVPQPEAKQPGLQTMQAIQPASR